MPTLTPFSIRYEEQQLLDLAAKARHHGAKRGYLHKADTKLKKLTSRWCCVYMNFLFYFESESCTKPHGVVFLEGCACRPVDQIGVPVRDVEGAFCIVNESQDGSSNKHFFFCARSDKERDEWMQAIANANMSKLLHELKEFRQKCAYLENKLDTTGTELLHLREANIMAHDDITHLRASLQCSPDHRRRRSSGFKCSSPQTPSPDTFEEQARVLQRYIRGWLIRRRWKRIVRQYLESPCADLIKKRNQLIWKFVASEEDYVSQLTLLNEEFRQQCEIAACSRKPPVTMEQCNDLFRNCDEILLFHQLFLRGVHSRIEKWPVVVFGDVLKLFIPMMSIYHRYIGNHTYALDLLLGLRGEASFRSFLDYIQSKPACKNMHLEELLLAPLKRISSYIQDLQELRAHTNTEHVDYKILHDTIVELEIIQRTVTDEVCQSETIRQVLKVEHRIEGGCEVLLDKEQALIREGVLNLVKAEEKTSTLSRGGLKLRTQQRYCFLFTKHLIITTRVQKKPHDVYRLSKDGVIPLSKCNAGEHQSCDIPELHYRAMRVERSHGDETETIVLLANSINEKAQWLADLSQCVENEKQNKILQSQSLGEPVELSSKFIRYSTFKTGKEQLVNCGNLDSLLQRLVKVSYFGLDFLNSFLMTFPIYTNAHTVIDFLIRNYFACVEKREKTRRGSMLPQDAVRDARAICESLPPRSPGHGFLTIPSSHPHTMSNGLSHFSHSRTASESAVSTTPTLSGIFFALKHWICKHFYHFKEDKELSMKLEKILDHACNCPHLHPNEKNAVLDVHRLYQMQQGGEPEQSLVIDLINARTQVHLPPKPFEVVLLWEPREAAEQLCIIQSTIFCRIGTGEILRHFLVKGEVKKEVAPNLAAIFENFNRMSLFFMWSIANQRYLVDRTKVMEFLILLAAECVQLNNFSSFMQIMSALDHGAIRKFKMAWEYVPKNLKQQYRGLVRLNSTDGRFRQLREAMKKAQGPSVPYLGIVLSELSALVEAMPTHIEDDLINFTKMRRCTRLITNVLQFQKETYDFTFVPEISKVLLCTPIPGNEDELYQFVDTIEEKEPARQRSPV